MICITIFNTCKKQLPQRNDKCKNSIGHTPMLHCCLSQLRETHKDLHILKMKFLKTKCCSLCYTYRRNCSPTTKMKLTCGTQEDIWPTINSKCKSVPQLQQNLTIQVGTKWSRNMWLVPAAARAIMWLATLLTPVVIDRKYLPLNPVNGTIHHK
jgi:hypothetical protein